MNQITAAAHVLSCTKIDILLTILLILTIIHNPFVIHSTAFSSLDLPPQPMVLQQSYIFTTSVRTLSVTTTELGITHKNLLLGLQSGYIYSLPKNYLDPRRTFAPTPQDREEGLIAYVPEIYTNPIAFINYNQTGTQSM